MLIRNIFAIALTPLLSLIAYVYTVKTRQLKWGLLFLPLFACAVLISVYDLSKSPIIFYIIMFIFVQLYVGKLVLNRRRINLYVISGATLIILMYVFIQGVLSDSIPALEIGEEVTIGANCVIYRGAKIGSSTLIADLAGKTIRIPTIIKRIASFFIYLSST